MHSPPVRGFCDSGSQINLITESCAQSMQLQRTKTKVPIIGIGTSIEANGFVDLTLVHRIDDNVCIKLKAFVVPRISGQLPDTKFESPFSNLVKNTELADPAFNRPGHIDLLLGAGTWAAIVNENTLRRQHNGNHAIAQSTILGWIIYGQIPSTAHTRLRCCHTTIELEDAKLDQMLVRFWDADTIPLERQWTADEQRAENNFVATYRRDLLGRYSVSIPLKEDAKPLGNSISVAKACFLGVEKRLKRDPNLFAQYKSVFDDYRKLRHMVLAPEKPPNDADSYYVPHHAINVSGGKGKFRVVFNASAKSSTGISFNEQQLAGPKLQEDLITIFLRFRAKKFGMTADIKQMFRQVNVSPEHWNYQRVFWRDTPSDELQEYVITVICWGQTSASFNAVRVVRQCAIDEQHRFPVGSIIALNDLYYDDLLSGAATEKELLISYQQTTQLLKAGGFELAKWATNSASLAEIIKEELHPEFEFPSDSGVLGMRWLPKTDMLRIKITSGTDITNDQHLTKRKVISATAQIFDPSGIVLPVIVTGKILQQEIWRSGIGWDDLLPAHLIQKWHAYKESIAALDQITVPRWLRINPGDDIKLHIFTDASEQAMGAVAYFRVTNADGAVTISMITSRSKIAPVKRVSIPRLELSAALLGAQLAQFIRSAFKITDVETLFWTDSTIVIHWLKKDPTLCKPFVANRVIAIREKSENGIWQHIEGTHNPADLLTRGMSASQLECASIWWQGPSWLIDNPDDWPISKLTTLSNEMQTAMQLEEKSIPKECHIIPGKSKTGNFVGIVINMATVSLGVKNDEDEFVPLTSRHSELSRLLRTTAYVLRFIENVRVRVTRRRSSKKKIVHQPVQKFDRTIIPAVNCIERQKSLLYWISNAQATFFSNEIKILRSGKKLPSGNRLVKLLPFIDAKGLLRVGGRLANANIPDGAKHQLILPPQATISQLIIRDAHFVTVHGGPQLMIAHLRRLFWITRMRQIVKSTVHHCPICVRFDQGQNEQLMGNLPIDRVTQSECFGKTGLDFAGPFIIRKQKGRTPAIERCSKEPKGATLKAWIVIFVCLATRAVHIDVIIGLKIEEFLAAFERFIMRKGRCTNLMSDNGTTFIGTDKELARVLQRWSTSLPEYNLTKFGTTWTFITPAAPFKGGIWEAAVKSMKRHLKRAVGVRILTKDELYQMAVHIEGCLNSRPLWPSSDDPNDLMPLTPAHFILAKPILPQPISEDVVEWPENRLTIWGQRQKLQQRIWKRWHDEYLSEKQVRTKWYKIEKNLKIGDMVIVRKENTPPAMWIIGRVIKVLTGSDNLVRSAIIKTPTGELERPINKLVFLPAPDNNSVDQPINAGEC